MSDRPSRSWRGVRAPFGADRRKTIGTLRSAGRRSDAVFEDGELVFGIHTGRAQGRGSAPRPAVRAALRHARPVSRVPARTGREAKIRDRCRSGHEGAECDGFRVVIAEVVHTCLKKEPAMLVEWWTPGQGLRGIDRD
jgi:hypothetical protein